MESKIVNLKLGMIVYNKQKFKYFNGDERNNKLHIIFNGNLNWVEPVGNINYLTNFENTCFGYMPINNIYFHNQYEFPAILPAGQHMFTRKIIFKALLKASYVELGLGK